MARSVFCYFIHFLSLKFPWGGGGKGGGGCMYMYGDKTLVSDCTKHSVMIQEDTVRSYFNGPLTYLPSFPGPRVRFTLAQSWAWYVFSCA